MSDNHIGHNCSNPAPLPLNTLAETISLSLCSPVPSRPALKIKSFFLLERERESQPLIQQNPAHALGFKRKTENFSFCF